MSESAAESHALLTLEEAAAYLHVSKRWLEDAVRDRKLRHTRLGKHIRFRVEYLEEFIVACEQPALAQVTPLRLDRRRSRL